jgi:hypothetical protein
LIHSLSASEKAHDTTPASYAQFTDSEAVGPVWNRLERFAVAIANAGLTAAAAALGIERTTLLGQQPDQHHERQPVALPPTTGSVPDNPSPTIFGPHSTQPHCKNKRPES